MMRKTWKAGLKAIGIAALLVSTTYMTAYAQQADFSGKWKLNKEKCDFGTLSPNSAAVDISVTQDKSAIAIERWQHTAAAELHYTEKIGFDGKAAETAISTDSKRTSTVAWSTDGKQLTESSVYTNGQHASEAWTLSGNSKTLTINKEVVMQDQKFELLFVYDKQ